MLEITPRIVDQVLVLDCSGRIAIGEDLAFYKNFLKQLLLTTDALVVNLEGVTYMDSSGLSIIIASYTSARERGATMKLTGVNNTIRDLFRITRLLEVLDIRQSVNEAVKAATGKAASA